MQKYEPFEGSVLIAVAQQFVLGLVDRAGRRGGGERQVAGERAGRGVLGDCGARAPRRRLGAARAAQQLQRQPALRRGRGRQRRLLIHRYHVRQHHCLLYFSTTHLTPTKRTRLSIKYATVSHRKSVLSLALSITHYTYYSNIKSYL